MAGLPTETFGGHHHVLAYVYDPVTETNVPMTQPGAAVAGAGAAIYDGVSAAIAATVKNYTNSHPLAVVTVDTNGDPYVAGGSSGLTDTQLRAADVKVTLDSEQVTIANFPATQPVSGTFYQATQPISAVSLPSHDVTNAGTFAVQASGSITANAGTNLNTSALALEAGHLATIDTSTAKIPSQGQALAIASMPVVLTAIQQAALTPPAAITGFGLEATQLLQATAANQVTGNASLALAATSIKQEPVATSANAWTTEGARAPFSQTLSGQTRVIDDAQPFVLEALAAMLVELRVMNTVLHTTLNSRDDLDALRRESPPAITLN